MQNQRVCVPNQPLERENGYYIKVNIESEDGIPMSDLGFECEFRLDCSGRKVVVGKAYMEDVERPEKYYAQIYGSELGGDGWLFCSVVIHQPVENWPCGYRDVTIDNVFTGIYLGHSCGRIPRKPLNCCNGEEWHDGFKVSFEKVEFIPKNDDLGDITGDEKVILTKDGENYQSTLNSVKAWALKNTEFLSYATIADYEADKENLTEPCYVGIDETDEVFLHTPKGDWNAYYEIQQSYMDFIVEQGMLDVIGGVPLTIRADLFNSFIVNGQEMITGNEVFDVNNPASSTIFAPTTSVGDVFEVKFTLKDLTTMEFGEDIMYLFAYVPLTKIILDESFASSLDDEKPYAAGIYGLYAAISLSEITFNFKADPYKGKQEVAKILIDVFCSDDIPTAVLAEGERKVYIPNGDWGVDYETFVDVQDETQFGTYTVFSAPEGTFKYHYTVERYDYGTI